MIDLYELRQLVAFADLGTLSRVAEEFHISTPSVTRSMQHLEDAFGATLFHRGKNKIGTKQGLPPWNTPASCSVKRNRLCSRCGILTDGSGR